MSANTVTYMYDEPASPAVAVNIMGTKLFTVADAVESVFDAPSIRYNCWKAELADISLFKASFTLMVTAVSRAFAVPAKAVFISLKAKSGTLVCPFVTPAGASGINESRLTPAALSCIFAALDCMGKMYPVDAAVPTGWKLFASTAYISETEFRTTLKLLPA